MTAIQLQNSRCCVRNLVKRAYRHGVHRGGKSTERILSSYIILPTYLLVFSKKWGSLLSQNCGRCKKNLKHQQTTLIERFNGKRIYNYVTYHNIVDDKCYSLVLATKTKQHTNKMSIAMNKHLKLVSYKMICETCLICMSVELTFKYSWLSILLWNKRLFG